MKLKKRRTNAHPKTSLEKEQAFVKISTNILVLIVIIAAIVFSVKESFGNINFNNDTNSLSALSALSTKVDTSQIITNQLSDSDKPKLISKLTASGLDILTDGELDYSKYSQNTVEISSTLSLSDQELGLLYSYIFIDNPDKYDITLYEISITEQDLSFSMKTVASINFYKLFTSKIGDSHDAETVNSLPKRVYVTNTVTYSNGEYSFSSVRYNNLGDEENSSISALINSTTPNVNLDKYVPNLIISMAENLALKSSTTFEFSGNGITFKKDA